MEGFNTDQNVMERKILDLLDKVLEPISLVCDNGLFLPTLRDKSHRCIEIINRQYQLRVMGVIFDENENPIGFD